MGRKLRNMEVGVIHHVYIRGNHGIDVFRREQDYEDYLRDLKDLARECKIEVIAYCLMPTHPHLCLRTTKGGAPLWKFMQRLNLRHARRFNLVYGFRGRLYESRYHAKEVDSEAYLLELIRYIHQNPLRAGLAKGLGEWTYSSYSAYLEQPAGWVETKRVLDLMGGAAGYQWLMEQRLTEEQLKGLRPVRWRPSAVGEDRRGLEERQGERPARLGPSQLTVPQQRERLELVAELIALGCSYGEAARVVARSRKTMSRLVAEACKKGLLHRQAPVPPRRDPPPCSEAEPEYYATPWEWRHQAA